MKGIVHKLLRVQETALLRARILKALEVIRKWFSNDSNSKSSSGYHVYHNRIACFPSSRILYLKDLRLIETHRVIVYLQYKYLLSSTLPSNTQDSSIPLTKQQSLTAHHRSDHTTHSLKSLPLHSSLYITTQRYSIQYCYTLLYTHQPQPFTLLIKDTTNHILLATTPINY